MDRGPIFVGGLDHSGKTLMRLSLSSHPNIAMTRRTYMWRRFYNRYGDLSRPANFERCLAAMLRYRHIRFLQPDPERLRREFRQGEPAYARLFALFQEHYTERLGKPRWGEQLGLVERYADLIFAAYPTAKMVHLIRDPRDRYTASLVSSRPRIRLGKVGEATAGWLYSARLAKRNRQCYPERYLILHCEALISRREETLRRVCAFLNEDFVPAMLTLEGAIRFGEAGDKKPNEKLDWDSVAAALSQRTRQLMSKREMAFMQAFAGRDMEAYGYELEPIRLSLGDRLWFYFGDWPANIARMVGWRTWDILQHRIGRAPSPHTIVAEDRVSQT